MTMVRSKIMFIPYKAMYSQENNMMEIFCGWHLSEFFKRTKTFKNVYNVIIERKKNQTKNPKNGEQFMQGNERNQINVRKEQRQQTGV